jgi:hypothetical protein
MLGRPASDLGVDFGTVEHLGGDKLPGQDRGVLVTLALSEVALQDGVRGPLAEIRFEHGCQCQPAPGSSTANPVSPRRHRPGS